MRLMGVALVFVVAGGVLSAGQSYPVSEVEIRLVRTPHGGCRGPCIRYRVTVRGDGTVVYDDFEAAAGTHTRPIAIDEVISLVNEFLQARFFDALDTYMNKTFVVRKGDTVVFYSSGGSDDPRADLTLRIGDRTKTVTLYNNYPAELGRLPELVDRIGGPQVWQRK